jgi:hypothetical protein
MDGVPKKNCIDCCLIYGEILACTLLHGKLLPGASFLSPGSKISNYLTYTVPAALGKKNMVKNNCVPCCNGKTQASSHMLML